MTQPPTTPDPSAESGPNPPVPPPVTPPTYSGYPAGPTPTGYPAPSAPTQRTYSAGKTKKYGRIGGLVLAVLVIGGKIAFVLGIGGVFGLAKNHVEHKAPEAETVVQTVLESNSADEITPNLAAGVSLGNVTDSACASFMSDGSWSKFSIPKSSLESDGSADVEVDVDGKDTNLNFHLANQNGWKIERFTCDG